MIDRLSLDRRDNEKWGYLGTGGEGRSEGGVVADSRGERLYLHYGPGQPDDYWSL